VRISGWLFGDISMKDKLKKMIYFISCVAIVVVSINLYACKPKDPFLETPISGETTLELEPKEFNFKKPFKPEKPMNKICFAYTGDLTSENISDPPKFRDGEELNIIATVVDQDGKQYQFDHITNSVDQYICLAPTSSGWLDINKRSVTFLKLTARSNRPINISKIQWVSYHPLDL
jgi:hypothetical protein